MYPFLRFAKETIKFRKAAPLLLTQHHHSSHRCWPVDIDIWMELNNGRTLTLLDLGRLLMFDRMQIIRVAKQNGWYLTVAGANVRYRRRVRPFEKFNLESRMLGWDDRFFYVEQSMWRTDGDCANNSCFRIALAGPNGIVVPQTAVDQLPEPMESPELPAWVQGWVDAEATRPWPPTRDTKVAR